MCNLYSVTKGQAAIREFTKAMRDAAGNQPSLPAIFPDQLAPMVRTTRDGERELTMLRWGFPPPPNLGNRTVKILPIHIGAHPHRLVRVRPSQAGVATGIVRDEALEAVSTDVTPSAGRSASQ